MLNEKKIVVVLPAYNAAKTVETTYREIPLDIVDEVVLVDDASLDDTSEVARKLGYDRSGFWVSEVSDKCSVIFAIFLPKTQVGYIVSPL